MIHPDTEALIAALYEPLQTIWRTKLAYTRVGNVLEWDRYEVMSEKERGVFWGLYVGRRASVLDPPGLFYGSVSTLAEDSRLGRVDTQNALTRMVDRGLVEVDHPRRVIRLTELPDRGNRPANGKCLYKWWRLWEDIPDCDLKYRHVALLEWLTQPFTKDHLSAWENTFGADGVQSRIRSNPEQTPAQQTFLLAESGTKPVPSIISAIQTPLLNEINDISNSIPTSVSVSVLSVSVPVEESEARSPESDSRPGFSVLDLVGALGETASDRVSLGPPMSDALTTPLRLLVAECHRESVTLDDVRLAGSWLAAGGLGYRDDLGMKWLAKAGELFDVVGLARKWDKRGRPELAASRSRATGGHRVTGAESYPAGAQAI